MSAPDKLLELLREIRKLTDIYEPYDFATGQLEALADEAIELREGEQQ